MRLGPGLQIVAVAGWDAGPGRSTMHFLPLAVIAINAAGPQRVELAPAGAYPPASESVPLPNHLDASAIFELMVAVGPFSGGARIHFRPLAMVPGRSPKLGAPQTVGLTADGTLRHVSSPPASGPSGSPLGR
ncbi:MAG: hypothetical protein ACE5EL_02260 [Anaerolineae bacterium]